MAAAQRQLELDTHSCFHVTANEPYIELAERLNTLVPGDHEKKTMFANSGAEAVENAVKIARKHTGRQGIVVFDHAFHGRTLMAMSLTAKVMPYKQGMGPFAPEIYRLPLAYPYRCPTGGTAETCAESCLAYAIDEMHKHIGEENIAAILIEPIQGEGGFIVPAPGFIEGLAEFAAANGIVFIADEIQSGMGRAGRWFAIEDEGVVPDIDEREVARRRAADLRDHGRAEMMDSVHVGGLGGTYGGNPVAAAALAVLDKIEAEGLLERSRTVGETIGGRLDAMAKRFDAVGDVRGRGAMRAIELVSDRETKEPASAETMRDLARRAGARRDRADRGDVRNAAAAAAGDDRGRAARRGPRPLEEAVAEAVGSATRSPGSIEPRARWRHPARTAGANRPRTPRSARRAARR